MHDYRSQSGKLKGDRMRDRNHHVCTSHCNWNAMGGDGFRNTSVEMDHETSAGGETNQAADRARPKVLMHNRKIIIPKTTPKTVCADRVADSTPPVYRPDHGTCRLEILD